MKWLYASVCAFILAVGIAVLLLVYGPSLSNSDRSIVYLLILVPLGLASAILLFKFLRSSASISGNMGRYRLRLSGPAAIFFIVIGIGYNFYRHPPNASPFNLAILFATHPDNGLRPSGKAKVTFQSRVEEIDVHDGVGILPDAQTSYKVEITPEINGFFKNPSVQVLKNEEPIKVTLVADSNYLNTKYRLESQFLKIINNYISCAFDFSRGLNGAVERIIALDSNATDDEIRFSNAYADAYNQVNSSADSLLYFLKKQSTDSYAQLFDLRAKVLEFHHKHFSGTYDNEIQPEINNYIQRQRADKTEQNKIRDDIHRFFSDTNDDLGPIKNRIDDFSNHLNAQS